MRVGVLLFLTTVFTIPIFGIDIEIPSNGLPKNVKSIQTYRFTKQDGKIRTGYVHYDRSGKKTEQKFYNKNGTLKWTVIYHYDKNENLQEKRAIHPNGDLAWRNKYTYDTKGRILKEVWYNSKNKMDYSVVHEYEANTTEIIMYGPDGSVRWRKKITVTEDSNRKKIYFFYPNGNRIKGIIKTYNDKELIKTETHFDEIGAQYRRIETEYDPYERISKRTIYNHKDEIHRRLWFEYTSGGYIKKINEIFPNQKREKQYTFMYRLDDNNAWIYKESSITIVTPYKEKPIIQRKTESRDIKYYSENQVAVK